MSILSASVLLFLVIDPLGNVPVFMSFLSSVDDKRHKIIVFRELLIALGILCFFLVAGKHLLGILRISESSLGIAGGVVLFMVAIRMIFLGAKDIFETEISGEPFVVPLATPFIAGPSAVATVMLISASDTARILDWLIAVLIAWSASGVILLFSGWLKKILGDRCLLAIERLMGMLLTTVAVEMLVTGLKEVF